MQLTTDDYVAIQQLYSRFAFAIDMKDFDQWLSTWTDDGTYVSYSSTVIEGQDALRKFAEESMAKPQLRRYHWTGNALLEATEYGAHGRAYLLHIPAPVTTGEVGVALYYDDELVKQDGEWLFRRRTTKVLS
jgi:hypothetical protein